MLSNRINFYIKNNFSGNSIERFGLKIIALEYTYHKNSWTV